MNYQSHKNNNLEHAFLRVFNKSSVLLSGTSGFFLESQKLVKI